MSIDEVADALKFFGAKRKRHAFHSAQKREITKLMATNISPLRGCFSRLTPVARCNCI